MASLNGLLIFELFSFRLDLSSSSRMRRVVGSFLRPRPRRKLENEKQAIKKVTIQALQPRMTTTREMMKAPCQPHLNTNLLQSKKN
jgi:hypothetical protein